MAANFAKLPATSARDALVPGLDKTISALAQSAQIIAAKLAQAVERPAIHQVGSERRISVAHDSALVPIFSVTRHS